MTKVEEKKPTASDGSDPTPASADPPPTPEKPAAVVLDDAEIARRIEAGVQAELSRHEQEAARKAAETQGEFEQLYTAAQAENEQLQAAVKDLKSENGKLTRYVNAQLDTEVAAWPEIVRITDPGADDLPARLAWADKVRPKVAEAQKKGARPQAAPAGPAALAPGANGHGGDDTAARASQASLYRAF